MARFAVSTLTLFFLTFGAVAQSILVEKTDDFEAIRSVIDDTGRVAIIVEFAKPNLPLATSEDLQRVREAVKAAQRAILASHFGEAVAADPSSGPQITLMDISPMFAVEVTASQLAALAGDPLVTRIHLNRWDRAELDQSTAIIKMTGPDGAFAAGATGTGQAVAVLDTGVDVNHPFISASRVAKEACFSHSQAGVSVSFCPGEKESDFGIGAGRNCNFATGDPNACWHGTHVAGIAEGRNPSQAGPRSGVAKDATLIPVQVFSGVFDAATCQARDTASPCVLSRESDQVQALDWIASLAITSPIRIAAVNMSLGGGAFYTPCQNDSRRPAIQRLRALNIATVIATGNRHYTSAVGAPACIEEAISVASSTKVDAVSVFSNMATMVDLLAPGGALTGGHEDINSSVPGAVYYPLAGTSMAAPHVAGAIAAIRTVRPSTVDQIEEALKRTGFLITDHRVGNGVRKPRINVAAAVRYLGDPALKVTPVNATEVFGPRGGPFFPAMFEYLLETAAGHLDYAISLGPDQTWLAVSPAGGTVHSSAPQRVAVSVQGRHLPEGVSRAFLSFVNMTNGVGSTAREVKLRVFAPNEPAVWGLSGPADKPHAAVHGVSGAGAVFAGSVQAVPGGNRQPAVWRNNLPTLLPLPVNAVTGEAWSVSSDGSVIAGYAVPGLDATAAPESFTGSTKAVAWFGDGSVVELPMVPGVASSSVAAVSSDGTTIVGNSALDRGVARRGFVWRNGTVTQLPMAGGHLGDVVVADVNRDGSVILGSDFQQATLWLLEADGLYRTQPLGFLPGHQMSMPRGISRDGRVVVGLSQPTNNDTHERVAFKYENGAMQKLPGLPGSSYNDVAIATNGDGSVIVGHSNGNAVRWTRNRGVESIKALLAAQGFGVERWNFHAAETVSDDGKTISGSGSYDLAGDGTSFVEVGWVVRLYPY